MTTKPSDRPKRVALVTHGFEIGGGVPTVARWLRDGLNNSGRYVVDVIDLATSSRDSSSRRLIDIRTWFRSSLLSRKANHSGSYHFGANATELEFMRYRPRRELTKFLNRYDLIQVVSGTPAWAAATRDCRVPTVLQVATVAKWERKSQRGAQAIPARLWRGAMTRGTTAVETVGIRHADVVMVENEIMMKHVRERGHTNVVMAPPGVDTERFCPSNSWNRRGHLLSVCRLGDPRKGLDRLVKAYNHMVQRDPNVPQLVLAGRGELSRPVHLLIANLGLESRIVVRHNVPENDLAALYRGASVFLQASHEEGFGLSLLQAMASGLPVIATDTAGSKETVIHGTTGFLIPQDGDVPGTICRHTLAMLQNAHNRFGENARNRCVATFSTEATLARFTQIYSDLSRADTTL
jgi:glycosyltransferase involved in cell wall biosynthesis